MSAPSRVGVLGGGRMGAGIAHAFLLAGAEVVVVERDETEADAAAARVRDSRASARSSAARPRARLLSCEAAFSTATDAAAFVDCELVVEAVPEDRALKTEALARAERAMPSAAVLATNTSSISIDDLAAHPGAARAIPRPALLQPGAGSTLVEVVTGAATAPELVGAARAWIDAIGKTAIVVRDSPGFASSRLGVALGLEAIRMLEEGVASAADIDAAMTLGYRHPVGPAAHHRHRRDSTCGSGSPKSCRRASARDSNRPRCCGAWWPRAGSAARAARASTYGRTTDDRHPAQLRPGRMVDSGRRGRMAAEVRDASTGEPVARVSTDGLDLGGRAGVRAHRGPAEPRRADLPPARDAAQAVRPRPHRAQGRALRDLGAHRRDQGRLVGRHRRRHRRAVLVLGQGPTRDAERPGVRRRPRRAALEGRLVPRPAHLHAAARRRRADQRVQLPGVGLAREVRTRVPRRHAHARQARDADRATSPRRTCASSSSRACCPRARCSS